MSPAKVRGNDALLNGTLRLIFMSFCRKLSSLHMGYISLQGREPFEGERFRSELLKDQVRYSLSRLACCLQEHTRIQLTLESKLHTAYQAV